MKSHVTNPSFFRVKTLLSLEISEVDSLARKAVGSLTSFRLLLGRCLLAMRETKGFKKYGCSSEIHYSVCRLGLSEGVAGDCRRVARDLLGLPDLTLAAEQGTIEWGKLREVSRKASPETEGLWLKLCGDLNYKQIEKLVAKTPKGGVPGDVFEDAESPTTEFRCRMSEEVLAMLDRARRMYSLEQDKAATTAEVLEWALASYISSQPVDEESLEKVRVEMDKDLQAEKARAIPLVAHAREVAAEMSCIPILGNPKWTVSSPARGIAADTTSTLHLPSRERIAPFMAMMLREILNRTTEFSPVRVCTRVTAWMWKMSLIKAAGVARGKKTTAANIG